MDITKVADEDAPASWPGDQVSNNSLLSCSRQFPVGNTWKRVIQFHAGQSLGPTQHNLKEGSGSSHKGLKFKDIIQATDEVKSGTLSNTVSPFFAHFLSVCSYTE